MEFMKLVKPHLIYFRLYGISLQTPEMTRKARIFMIFCNILNIFYVFAVPIAITVYSWTRVKNVMLTERSILNIFIYIGIFIVQFISILETFFTKRKQFNFWNTLLTIEKTFVRDKYRLVEANRCLRWKITKRLIGITLITVMCKAGYLVNNRVMQMGGNWFYVELMSFWAQENGRLSFMSHFLFVEILRMHVELYNEKTREVTKMARKYSEGMLLSEMNLLKLRHCLIWKLNEHLNSFFQWAQTINFLQYFFAITNLIYWIYYGTRMGRIEYLIRMILNLTLTVLNLVHLVYSCEKLKQEANKTPPLIHEINHEVPNPFDVKIHDAVMAVSMQVQHEKITITYGGFFNIDMSLITSISATMTTYLVIFIQFVG
ncbi:hypothetical protein DMENIID0001_088230 [Sergentomyia squamirostris]